MCQYNIATNGNWEGNVSSDYSLSNNLASYSKALSSWGKNLNAFRKNRISVCKKELKNAYDNSPHLNFEIIHKLKFELDKLLEEEESNGNKDSVRSGLNGGIKI